MKKYILNLKVVSNEQFGKGYSLLRLTDEQKALPDMRPGQFVQVRACAEGGLPLLRRPISINFLSREKNELWLLVHNVGQGTNYICSLRAGDTANIVLPLGNGFTLAPRGDERVGKQLLVGGGVGTAPLLYLERTAAARNRTHIPSRRTLGRRYSSARRIREIRASFSYNRGRIGRRAGICNATQSAATRKV